MLAYRRQAWLQYCLINPSGKCEKFMPDDLSDKRIIMLNKEKIQPSANVKVDEFLRDTVSMNATSPGSVGTPFRVPLVQRYMVIGILL